MNYPYLLAATWGIAGKRIPPLRCGMTDEDEAGGPGKWAGWTGGRSGGRVDISADRCGRKTGWPVSSHELMSGFPQGRVGQNKKYQAWFIPREACRKWRGGGARLVHRDEVRGTPFWSGQRRISGAAFEVRGADRFQGAVAFRSKFLFRGAEGHVREYRRSPDSVSG